MWWGEEGMMIGLREKWSFQGNLDIYSIKKKFFNVSSTYLKSVLPYVMVLCYLSWFFLIWAISFYSVLVLFDQFCVIWAGSLWTERINFDLWWSFWIWAGSFWSVMVLCDLSCFFGFSLFFKKNSPGGHQLLKHHH